MNKAAQKINSTTQKFIEIEDIADNLVLLSGGRACLVIEVMATNFTLQSKEDQQAKILSYASLLNSLSFPIQIVIISRRVDISSYLTLLDGESQRTQNQMLSTHIRMYRDFVAQLVQKNSVLDKKFYLVISYSILEKGATGVADIKHKDVFVKDAKTLLDSKATSIAQELQRIGLKSKILGKKGLAELYYGIYNSEAGKVSVSENANSPVIRGK